VSDDERRFRIAVGDMLRDIVDELVADRLAERLLTVDEAAGELRVHPQTVRELLRKGAPHYRHSGPRGAIRISLRELRAWSAGRDSEDEHDHTTPTTKDDPR
jgi:excisionase family DNA binding protein